MAETIGVFEVEAILEKRQKYARVKSPNSSSTVKTKRVEYLVQWKGFSKGQETWEPLSNLSTAMALVKEFNRVGSPVTIDSLFQYEGSPTSQSTSPKMAVKDVAYVNTYPPGSKRPSTSIYAADRSPSGSSGSNQSSPSSQTKKTSPRLVKSPDRGAPQVNGDTPVRSGKRPMNLPLRILLKPQSKSQKPITALKTKNTNLVNGNVQSLKGQNKKNVSKAREMAKKVVSTILNKKSTAKGKVKPKGKGKGPAAKTVTKKVVSKKTIQNNVQKGQTKTDFKTAKSQENKKSAKAAPTKGTVKQKSPNSTSQDKIGSPGSAINSKVSGKKELGTNKTAVKNRVPKVTVKKKMGAKKVENNKKTKVKKFVTIKLQEKGSQGKQTSAKPSETQKKTQKRKNAEVDSETDSDNIRYLLADDEKSLSNSDDQGSDIEYSTKKRLKLSLTPIDEKKDLSKLPCTVTSPEIKSMALGAKRPLPKYLKKLLLKDSIKWKPKTPENSPRRQLLRPDSALAPRTPPQVLGGATPFKTPPSTPSAAGNSSREVTPSKGHMVNAMRVPSVPVLPNSPPAPSFESLMKNLSKNFYGSRANKRKGSESDESGIERRVSVRQSENAFKYKEIVVKKAPGFTQIFLLTQTKVKNALNPKVFTELHEALRNAEFDDSRLIMLAGSGTVFCSGVDLNYLLSGDRRNAAKEMADSIRDFVSALIAFPKPIVAAVNGPAVGLGFAILPLCDIIYASDKASFYCPYTKLGQTPEGCASLTLPNVMGMAMANELLLGGRCITAIEACQSGLVSQVFWPTSMLQEVIPRVQQMAQQSAKALEASKILIRSHQRTKLEYVNETECQMLQERWSSSDCHKAMRAYLDSEPDM